MSITPEGRGKPINQTNCRIEKLVSLLDNADEDLAMIILNILTDLTEREEQPTLGKDAPDLERVLRSIALRFPFTGNQPEKILALAQ